MMMIAPEMLKYSIIINNRNSAVFVSLRRAKMVSEGNSSSSLCVAMDGGNVGR